MTSRTETAGHFHHDVFLSYARSTEPEMAQLAQRLEKEGLTVWRDHALESHGAFEGQIREALDLSRAAIVLWSDAALESRWVTSEANRADAAGKLVSVAAPGFDPSRIPAPFDRLHTTSFQNTAAIVAAVAKTARGAPLASGVDPLTQYAATAGGPLLDPKVRDDAPDSDRLGPAELLRPSLGIVPFQAAASGTLFAELLDWARNGDDAARGRLIHGPGGLGKTRLALELARVLRSPVDGAPDPRKWEAGFIDLQGGDLDRLQDNAIRSLVRSQAAAGVLLIVDYAESTIERLAQIVELFDGRGDGAVPVRVLLLARDAGEWWDSLSARTPALSALFTRRGVRQANRMPEAEASSRLQLFDAARDAFALYPEAIGFSATPAPAAREIRERIEGAEGGDQDPFARPLTIAMAGLLSLYGGASQEQTIPEMVRAILAREREYWDRALGLTPDDAVRRKMIWRAVAQATLIGGVDGRESAEALLLADAESVGGRSPLDAAVLREALGKLSPRSGQGIAALEPDLIGERHVAETVDEALVDGCIAEDADRAEAVMIVLNRAGRSLEHGAAAEKAFDVLKGTVLRHGLEHPWAVIGAALYSPGPMAQKLEALVDEFDGPTLRELVLTVPLHTVALRGFALKACDAWLAHARAVADGTIATTRDLALALNRSSVHLSATGREDVSAQYVSEALRLRRKLAERDPEHFEAGLSATLLNHAISLSRAGEEAAAFAVVREAVEIRRRVVERHPEHERLHDLATALVHQAAYREAEDDLAGALADSEEALEIFRGEPASISVDAGLDIPFALFRHAKILEALGRAEESVKAASDGLAILADISEQAPDAVTLRDAQVLAGVRDAVEDLGDLQIAKVAGATAVQFFERLLAVGMQEVASDLVVNRSLHATLLWKTDESEEALRVYRAARDQFVDSARNRSNPLEPAAPYSLMLFTDLLAVGGEPTLARDMAAPVLPALEELATVDPETFTAPWAYALGQFAAYLHDAGDAEAAMAAYDRAADKLTDRTSDWGLGLLRMRAMALNAAGRFRESAKAMREVVAAFRSRGAATAPENGADAHRAKLQLVDVLKDVSVTHESLNETEEMLAAAREAAEIARSVDPSHLEPAQALSISILLLRLHEGLETAGHPEEARGHESALVGLWPRMEGAEPDLDLAEFAARLSNLAGRMELRGDLEIAAATVDRALSQFRRLADEAPDAVMADMARSLTRKARIEAKRENIAASLDAARESTEIRERLAATGVISRKELRGARRHRTLLGIASWLSGSGKKDRERKRDRSA